MSLCWFCYWGWPEPVAGIYQSALEALDGDSAPLDYGPGHVVWSDENFDLAEECLEDFDEEARLLDYRADEIAIARSSLELLAQIPLAIRNPVPSDYDGEHPAQYPPDPSVSMVKVGLHP